MLYFEDLNYFKYINFLSKNSTFCISTILIISNTHIFPLENIIVCEIHTYVSRKNNTSCISKILMVEKTYVFHLKNSTSDLSKNLMFPKHSYFFQKAKQHFLHFEDPNGLSRARLRSPPLGFPGVSLVLLGSPVLSWAPLGFPGLSWALLGSLGLPWALLGSPGLSWALLGSPGLSWALLGSFWASPQLSCALVILDFLEYKEDYI